MSIKNKVFAAAATLTLVGGVGAAGAMSASAATPSAGPSAVDIFSPLFGTHHAPTDVLDVLRQGEKVGQPIILFRASNFDPAEDFSLSYQGLVSDFFAAGLVSATTELHYGGGSTLPSGVKTADDPAFEVEYSPYGVQSGLCVGVGATAAQGGKVSLQPCGVSSKTVWIADVGLVPGTPTTSVTTIADAKVVTCTLSHHHCKAPPTVTVSQTTTSTTTLGSPASIDNYLTDDPTALEHGYAPVINGSNTNFSHPFVLTYSASGSPTDTPRPQLFVSNLTGFSDGSGAIVGTVNENQLWGAVYGELGI
ncbi:MAG: hypothetical protein ACLQB1_25575 [Streptosporangiaceae bacterium]